MLYTLIVRSVRCDYCFSASGNSSKTLDATNPPRFLATHYSSFIFPRAGVQWLEIGGTIARGVINGFLAQDQEPIVE